MKPSEVILYPLMTEKSMKLIDENKIVLVVPLKAKKPDITKAVKELYGKEVAAIRTLRTIRNKKKAYVTLKEEGAAAELATALGMI